MRSGDATSRKIGRRAGVVDGFQVIANTVEPFESSTLGNLLSKDDCRATLLDEMEERRP